MSSATQLVSEFRRIADLHFRYRIDLTLNVRFDFRPMIKIVRQSRVDVGKRYTRIHLHDFVRREAAFFVPDDNIHHSNPMSGDAWLASHYPWGNLDVLGHDVFHATSIASAPIIP